MKVLKSSVLALVAAAAAACGGGSSGGAEETLSVYRYLGSVQCTGGGTSLSTLERQLLDASVRVAAASCGLDGKAYAAVCGAPDGRIGIFDVAAQHASIAEALGFDLLSRLPGAVRAPCG